MIEKTVSGQLLENGKKYKGTFEQGVSFRVRDENDGKTYIACFVCDNAEFGIPFDKGQYLVLSGHLRYSNSKYDELDVQHISIPHVQFFDVMEN
jgi:hypothetical protein